MGVKMKQWICDNCKNVLKKDEMDPDCPGYTKYNMRIGKVNIEGSGPKVVGRWK